MRTDYYLPFGPEIKLGQPYGARPGLKPNPPGGHNGDDWLTWIGVPVRAAGNGEVVFAGQFDDTWGDNFGWNINYGGYMVVLNMDGADEPYFEYGHLSEIFVKTGDRVVGGQIIAKTGNSDGGTGVSSGPHCHVGCLPPNFNLNTNTYGRINPRLYMTRYYDPVKEGEAVTAEAFVKEDELSEAQVNALRADLFHVFDRLINEIPGLSADAVFRKELPYAHPETAEITGQPTTLATMAVYNDFQHSASRRQITGAIVDGVRSIIDAVKAAPEGTASEVAEEAYNEFLKKLDNFELTITAKSNSDVIDLGEIKAIEPITSTAPNH